ncbi:MAG TPA: hypothetical protein G4N92_08695 [Anaerolineae bacterium]|nr:hypothetical protein [Anaerolineae bacterium]
MQKPVIISTAIITIILCLFIGVIQLFVLPTIIDNGISRAIVTIIPSSFLTKTSKNTQPVLSTDSLEEFPPGIFSVGMIVRVEGTEDEGLRIRVCPGIECKTHSITEEGNVFEIIDGPEISNGFIWWKIISLEEDSIYGWAVQDYLTLLFYPKPLK